MSYFYCDKCGDTIGLEIDHTCERQVETQVRQGQDDETGEVTVPCVRLAKREDVGGCNGCTSKDENVTVIELRSISFRLCWLCKSVLHSKLAQ